MRLAVKRCAKGYKLYSPTTWYRMTLLCWLLWGLESALGSPPPHTHTHTRTRLRPALLSSHIACLIHSTQCNVRSGNAGGIEGAERELHGRDFKSHVKVIIICSEGWLNARSTNQIKSKFICHVRRIQQV